MDGAGVGSATAGEGTGTGNLGGQGTGVVDTGQVSPSDVNGEIGEENSGEAQKNTNFSDFNMLEEGEVSQEQKSESEEEGEALELNLFEGEEYSEEEMAEINNYANIAKELGMNKDQFNTIFRTVQLRMNNEAIAKIDAKIASEKNSLQNLKNELTIEERTSWQPLAKQLTAEFGEDTAKAIMLNPNVYRAFLGKNRGEGISIKKSNIPKLSHEQALDARTAELQENLGNDTKIQEILNKYLKDYPEYFEKK
ncbi:MAG: hypothetical protein ACRC7S_12440 [Cetobacterium sp.]